MTLWVEVLAAEAPRAEFGSHHLQKKVRCRHKCLEPQYCEGQMETGEVSLVPGSIRHSVSREWDWVKCRTSSVLLWLLNTQRHTDLQIPVCINHTNAHMHRHTYTYTKYIHFSTYTYTRNTSHREVRMNFFHIISWSTSTFINIDA